MKNRFSGSSFDDFLAEENLEVEVAARAAKRTFVYQLEKQIKRKKVKKVVFRKAFHSPTTASRLFDDHIGVSLQTLSKAANLVNCNLVIGLEPIVKKRA
jgi:antitoxin HicB